MFQVVQDQLKVSQGWVRCGQCEQVFDATANLVQEPPALTTPLATPPGAPAPSGMAPMAAAPSQRNWEEGMVDAEAGDLALPDELEHLDLEIPDASAWREPRWDEEPPLASAPATAAPVPSALRAAEPPPEEDIFPAPSASTPRPAAMATAREGKPVPSQAEPAPMAGGDDEGVTVEDLSFMRRSRWRHPAVRALLFLLCCVLALGLLVQVVRHERDRIAASHPDWRSWLHVLCEQLDCELEPLRQIESVVIDGSAFSKIRDELYQLNLTLRNKAAVDLALPAVELVLTDVQDQVLIRRVLLAQELGSASGAAPGEGLRDQGASRLIRAGQEFQATVLMEIKNGSRGSGLEGRVAGYRLLAFYP
jgi:predicted Zn finger-like uncharacterized protein